MAQAYSDPGREQDPHSLPDSTPEGPYDTETEALAAAQDIG